jgi:hypothetical protein
MRNSDFVSNIREHISILPDRALVEARGGAFGQGGERTRRVRLDGIGEVNAPAYDGIGNDSGGPFSPSWGLRTIRR